ncbi:MAG: transporter substrate-binding domain-containing protein [Candidatus Omnitrophota bacterium]
MVFKKFLFALLFCSVMAFGTAAFADTITVRADSWPPYNADPAADHPGYVVEILKAIYTPLGHTIDYQTMPWTRAVEDATAGKIDAIIGASIADAPKCVYPAEAMGAINNIFLVKKGSAWKYAGVSSLKGVKLGVIDGYSYDDGADIDKYIASKAADVEIMTGDGSLDRNLKKLQAGRLDTVLENDIVITATLKTLGLDPAGFENAGAANSSKDLFVAFAPGNEKTKQYAAQWDEGIKKLRASGELRKILDRYSVQDWK